MAYQVAHPATTFASASRGFACSSCGVELAGLAEFRAHCKTEHHVENVRRRAAGLSPVPLELQQPDALPVLKETEKAAGEPAWFPDGRDSPAASPIIPASTGSEAQSYSILQPIDAKQSLFDRESFETEGECLAYMQQKYSFFVPDPEELVDLSGLLTHLGRQIKEMPHRCISCHRCFGSLAGVWRHMLDKGHTQVGTQAVSRHGHFDAFRTAQWRLELARFYRSCPDTESTMDIGVQDDKHRDCFDGSGGSDYGDNPQDEAAPEALLQAFLAVLHDDIADDHELLLPSGAAVGRRMTARRQALVRRHHKQARLALSHGMGTQATNAAKKEKSDSSLAVKHDEEHRMALRQVFVANEQEGKARMQLLMPAGAASAIQKLVNRRRGSTRQTSFGGSDGGGR